MSYKIEITEKAQEEAREAIHWIAQYSPENAALWYFIDDETVIVLRVRHQAQDVLKPEDE